MKSYSDSYKAAGVDVTAGYKSVELMKEHVKRTSIPGVVSGIGGFGGLFPAGHDRYEKNLCLFPAQTAWARSSWRPCCSISMTPSALTALPCA